MTFDQAVAFVLDVEKEWSWDQRGGLTRWGIASKAHPDVDVQTLTREGAIAIYQQRYWNLCRCDELPGALAPALFDGAVQHGPLPAIKLLQAALGVEVDGLLGPKTLAAAHARPWAPVLVDLLARRIRLYASLTDWGSNGLGWSRRVLALQRAIYDAEGEPRS